MNKFLFISLFIVSSAAAFAQKAFDFNERVDSLKVLGKSILAGKTDADRIASNEKFLLLMKEIGRAHV